MLYELGEYGNFVKNALKHTVFEIQRGRLSGSFEISNHHRISRFQAILMGMVWKLWKIFEILIKIRISGQPISAIFSLTLLHWFPKPLSHCNFEISRYPSRLTVPECTARMFNSLSADFLLPPLKCSSLFKLDAPKSKLLLMTFYCGHSFQSIF